MIIQYCTERGLNPVDAWIQIKKRDGENRTAQHVFLHVNTINVYITFS